MSKIKELLKNKKIVAGALLALILVVALVAVLLYHPGDPELPVAESSQADVSGEVVVNIPDDTTTQTATEQTATTGSPGVLDVKGDPEQKAASSTTRTKAEKPAKPVTTATAPPEVGGIQIGGGEQPQIYDCKTPNHHCRDAEAHAWIQNLEIQGCEVCGAHDCPSIYAVDEWGGACPDLKKCPHYDEKKDPLEYCQACGRKNGDGDNNTCQKWIVDFTCPKCGQLVKANECHTHG